MKKLEVRTRELAVGSWKLEVGGRELSASIRGAFTCLLLMLSTVAIAQKEPIQVAKGHQVEIKTSAICEMCQHAIEYELTFTKGIKNAELDLDSKVVTVIYNGDKISADEIRKRITKIGYHADWMERDLVGYENLPFCCKDGSHGTPIPQVPLKKRN